MLQAIEILLVSTALSWNKESYNSKHDSVLATKYVREAYRLLWPKYADELVPDDIRKLLKILNEQGQYQMALSVLNYLGWQSPGKLYGVSFDNSDIDYKFQYIAALKASGDFAKARTIAATYRDQAIRQKFRTCLLDAEVHVIKCLLLEKKKSSVAAEVAEFLSKVKGNYSDDFYENARRRIYTDFSGALKRGEPSKRTIH
jgi:hypothetical protein